MATLHTCSLSLTASNHKRIQVTLQPPTCSHRAPSVSLPNPTTTITTTTTTTTMTKKKLYAIAEAASDRAGMHAMIAKQRDNWNHLLLHSTNSITLSASITSGISHLHSAFRVSSALLFASATAIMIITNKIQPSQLAEEQRNASRLFRLLEKTIHTKISATKTLTEFEVDEAMERVFALDKAYPLPLVPGMLEKFPEKVEPTIWWPKLKPTTEKRAKPGKALEKEMKGIAEMIRRKDIEQYVSFGRMVLRVNRVLAFLGPMLSGVAAVGVSLGWQWSTVVAVVGGAAAAVVNTMQHGGQVGMVFELSRNCGGFYKELEEEIEGKMREGELREEEWELFEMKVGLRLGRRVCELKGFGGEEEDVGEFAGKLF